MKKKKILTITKAIQMKMMNLMNFYSTLAKIKDTHITKSNSHSWNYLITVTFNYGLLN